MNSAKLVVAHCSKCETHVVPCVVVENKAVCRACDRTGTYVKLATYSPKK